MSKPFQRIGTKSNAQAGRDFEIAAQKFLASIDLDLSFNLKIPVGIDNKIKDH